MTMKTTPFFGAEDVVNITMTPDEGGVVTWWQAEILLGLIEQDHSQSICEARLRHVSQVVREMYEKSVPRRRSRSTTHKETMPPDESDDSDESNYPPKSPSSPDTLQNTCSNALNTHVPSSTSTSSKSGHRMSLTNYVDSSYPVRTSYLSGELIVLNETGERLRMCRICYVIWPSAFFPLDADNKCADSA